MLRFLFICLFLFVVKLMPVGANPLIAQTDSSVDDDVSSYMSMYGENGCEVYDPYQKVNRIIYGFNSVIDKYFLRPVAMGYDKITNDYVKGRVGSFIDNVGTPISTVNHALQFNYDNTMKSFWRFMINSTLGIGGLFDVASKVGLAPNPQGFGDTLGSYGVAPGPYIVLPLIGGTTARGLFDYVFTTEFFLPTYVLPPRGSLCYSAGRLVHLRAKLLPFTDNIMQNSIDSYVNIRSSIFQNKESTVKYPKKFVCPIKK